MQDFMEDLHLTLGNVELSGTLSQLNKRYVSDNKFAKQILKREYYRVTDALRTGTSNANDGLHFGAFGEMAMTGLEYAVWRLDLRMVSIFFVFGAGTSDQFE